MKRFVTLLALCLLAGQAWGGTFELSDPAAEMQKDREAWDQREAARQQEAAGEAAPTTLPHPAAAPEKNNVLCTVDTASRACTCIDQVSARTLPLTRDECVTRVRKSLELQD